LIVTTKKGKKGGVSVTIGHTTNLETVSFYPGLQNQFGSGTNPGYPTVYVPYENQQYGPRFDGTLKPIGKPIDDGTPDGAIQVSPYSATSDNRDFWDTGVTNQTDFSISGGDDKSTTFLSLQYLKNSGTTPKDVYKR